MITNYIGVQGHRLLCLNSANKKYYNSVLFSTMTVCDLGSVKAVADYPYTVQPLILHVFKCARMMLCDHDFYLL